MCTYIKEIWIEYAKNCDKCQLHIKRKKRVKVFNLLEPMNHLINME